MIKKKLFANFAHPRGVLGRVAGRIMAAKADNNARARWAVAELDPKPDARVLEVGYGPGVAIALMTAQVPDGTVVGVDSSDVMRAQAQRRNRSSIAAGRVDLRVGDAQALDDVPGAPIGEFDLVYGINVVQFWSDSGATVADLAGRLAPSGRLALVYMQPPGSPLTAAESGRSLREQFAVAGLGDVEAYTMDHRPPAVMVVGHAPSDHDSLGPSSASGPL